jgi:NADH-quinone oxidoreductase subunit C
MVDITSFQNNLSDTLGESVISIKEEHSHIIFDIQPNAILEIVTYLKSKKGFSFTTLIDITAIDFPAKEKRFQLIYHFLSMTENKRCKIITDISDHEAINSITSLFECANWFEREIFDLFGIKFSAHPDLRRILTDYGFKGHPLRKDFPTSGFLEVRYDELEKRVIYEPTNLTQGYRNFDFLSPWDISDVYANTRSKNKD